MQKCVETLEDLDLATSIFFDRLADTLPNKQLLLASMSHFSGLRCVDELQDCQVSPAGQGQVPLCIIFVDEDTLVCPTRKLKCFCS